MSAKSDTFFGSLLKTFRYKITILAIVELVDKVEEIKKNIRTWGCGTSRFPAMELSRGGRRGSQISIFFRTNILSKPFIPYCSHDWPKTFPHCYAVLFSYISSTQHKMPIKCPLRSILQKFQSAVILRSLGQKS